MVSVKKHVLKNILFGGVFFFVMLSMFVFEAEEPLKIGASMSPRRLRRGQEGYVILKISLGKDIAISSQPFFTIELASSEELSFPKSFFSASDLEIEIIEEEGKEYLNLKEPIQIPFTVKMGAQRGNHSLQGKIKYFACSKEEAWCLKSTSKFSAGFYTSSRVYEKRN
ncbi:MAG: hypothetical protein JXB23_10605 [Candidatus Aminicenantes bacterium]|nr:hypothetical protein [Candidatus Aminicenantes bacterium]